MENTSKIEFLRDVMYGPLHGTIYGKYCLNFRSVVLQDAMRRQQFKAKLSTRF